MKLTGLIMLVGCMQLSAAVFSQNVSLNERNSKLEKVFTEIRKQTGYNFLYNNSLLKKSSPVTLQAEQLPVEEALERLFDNQPLSYSIIEKTIVVKEKRKSILDEVNEIVDKTYKVLNQDETITGKVFDENGQSLPGVTVTLKSEKSQSRSVVTDSDGKFRFANVPSDAVLVVNFIGFKSQTLPVEEQRSFNIKLLPDITELKSVVVTGYQEIKKESYTGTAITISGEELKRVNPTNLLQSIQAFDPSFKILDNNLAGSNPNNLPTINVRGTSSLPTGGGEVLRRDNMVGNSNLPTFIMDGYEVPIQKVFDLDINRVESITLLKDAAAAAVYGSRAANGVVVIVTKAPKDGKLQVTYNLESFISGPDISDYELLNGAEKLEYERLNGMYSTAKNEALSQDDLDELYYQKLANVVGGVNTHWISSPLKTSIGQRNSLYLEGGSKVFRYGIDLRYQTQPGVLKGSGRDRMTGGMSFSYNMNNKLLLRNDIVVASVKGTDSPYGNFSTYVRTNPYYPRSDANGNLIREIDLWTDRGGEGNGIQRQYVLNPLFDAQIGSFSESKYLELTDMFSADLTLSHGLRLRGQVSLINRNNKGDQFTSPQANEFYFYDSGRQDEKGRYTNATNDELSLDANIRLTWVKQFTDHLVNFALGSNVRTATSDFREFTAIGFANDRFSNIGFAGQYENEATPTSQLNRERLLGGFLSMNYSYKNRYLMDASFRADGSSKFGMENKVAPFWAIGLGWNLHQEQFLKNSIFSQLRLRASIGETGSVNFEPYLSKTTFNYYTNNWYSTGIGASVGNFGNESLGWQKTTEMNAGMEIGLFADRLYIAPRIYRRYTNGLLADIQLAPSTGFSFYKENLGDMVNKGAELNVRWNAIRTSDWSLTLNTALVANRNKIVKISNALTEYNRRADESQVDDEGKLIGVPLLRYKEGQSVNAIYAVRSLGIDPENGKELFVKADGSLSHVWDVRDITVVGDGTPFAEGSFGPSLSYKNIFFSINFMTNFGGDTYNQTLVDRVENADVRYNVDRRVLEERWRQPGDNAFYKDIADDRLTNVSSRFVQRNNVLNLQSLYFSYDVSKKLLSKFSITNLRLALTANDVWRSSSIKEERGIDYPFARNFNFSLQTIF